jgi:hypothetical protein
MCKVKCSYIDSGTWQGNVADRGFACRVCPLLATSWVGALTSTQQLPLKLISNSSCLQLWKCFEAFKNFAFPWTCKSSRRSFLSAKVCYCTKFV